MKLFINTPERLECTIKYFSSLLDGRHFYSRPQADGSVVYVIPPEGDKEEVRLVERGF